MKANKFFLGLALIGAILTGCEKNPGQTGDYDSKSYMSVSIAQAGGTRAGAGADGGYIDGTAAENTIKSIDFYFYKADGSAFTFGNAQNGAGTSFTSNVYTYTPGTGDITDGTGTIDDIVNAVLVIQHNKGNIPAYMIAVINGSAEYNGQTMTYVKENVITNYQTAGKGHIMTNSVYEGADGISTVMETPISYTNLAINADQARLNPVKIYVERTAARVEFKEVTASANQVYPTGTTVTDALDNSYTVHAKIMGWDIVTIANNTTLAKKINTSWDAQINGMTWNRPADYRSYWADADKTGNLTKTFKWEGLTNTIGSVDYCLENTTLPVYDTQMTDAGTTIEDKDKSRTNLTKVVVAARLYSDDAATVPFELANWYGQYYRLNDLKTAVALSLKDKLLHLNAGVYTPIQPAQIELVQNIGDVQNSYEVYFTLASGVSTTDWYEIKPDNSGYNSVSDPNTVLGNVENAKMWNGMSYYIVNIEHLGVNEKVGDVYQPAYYGVVRNHAYEISFSGVSGLGTPVYDATAILPEPVTEETTESFVAAEINVLSWHLVKQTVTLQ